MSLTTHLQVAPKLLLIPARTTNGMGVAAKPPRLPSTTQPTEVPRVAAKFPSEQLIQPDNNEATPKVSVHKPPDPL